MNTTTASIDKKKKKKDGDAVAAIFKIKCVRNIFLFLLCHHAQSTIHKPFRRQCIFNLQEKKKKINRKKRRRQQIVKIIECVFLH